jgi:signal transduction histidine kinase
VPVPASLLLAVFFAAAAPPPEAARREFGTREEAEGLVVRAVAHIKDVGAKKAYKDFTDQTSAFVDRDLYVVVYDLEGRVLAHGQKASLVGESLLNVRDPSGKPWIKERVDLAKKKDRFWHDYKFLDPITKRSLEKSSYCERVESTVVCAGIYKR